MQKADAKRPKVEKRSQQYIDKLNSEDNLRTFEECVEDALKEQEEASD